MPKLTLTVSADILKITKLLAKEHGLSASELFTRFIRAFDDTSSRAKIPPKTKQATGLIKLPKRKTDKQLIEDALSASVVR